MTELKITFTTKDKDSTKKDLFASIKYGESTEALPLNKRVTDEELSNETSAIHTFLKTVRKALHAVVEVLNKEQKTINAATIKQYFLEHNKELFA